MSEVVGRIEYHALPGVRRWMLFVVRICGFEVVSDTKLGRWSGIIEYRDPR